MEFKNGFSKQWSCEGLGKELTPGSGVKRSELSDTAADTALNRNAKRSQTGKVLLGKTVYGFTSTVFFRESSNDFWGFH